MNVRQLSPQVAIGLLLGCSTTTPATDASKGDLCIVVSVDVRSETGTVVDACRAETIDRHVCPT